MKHVSPYQTFESEQEKSTPREEVSKTFGPCVAWRLSNGKAHRKDGPAIIYQFGRSEWRDHGVLHRVGGPAVHIIKTKDGPESWSWWFGGSLHRDDGPAVERGDGTIGWHWHGKAGTEEQYAKANPEGYQKWIDRMAEKDPSFVTDPRFVRHASREAKDKYPQLGADFGFFDTKTNESSKRGFSHPRRTCRFRVGDMVYVKPGRSIEQSDKFGRITGKEVGTDLNDFSDVFYFRVDHGDVLSQDQMTPADEEFRKRFQEDLEINPEDFAKYASLGLKREHPEAGTNFGFFDAKKTNESVETPTPRFEVGDKVYVHPNGTGTEHFGTITNRSVWEVGKKSTLLKWKYSTDTSTLRVWGDEELTPADVEIRRRIQRDPSFTATRDFAMFASPELKAKYPEAGTDFGFFDVKKTNESTDGSERFTLDAEKASQIWCRHHPGLTPVEVLPEYREFEGVPLTITEQKYDHENYVQVTTVDGEKSIVVYPEALTPIIPDASVLYRGRRRKRDI